jgi:UDP-N-acetylglucosamine 3-dehydrogenase
VTTRIGLIGAGFIGAVHAKALSALPDAKLVAVADPQEDRARALASPAGAAAYASHRDMLAKEQLDAVIVATPDNAHREPCIDAARAGLHIFVEKPLATSLADCDAIAAAVEESKVRALVGHTLRWEPRYALAQQAIRSGDLGTISYMYARRNNIKAVARRAGGYTNVARFLAVHDIDWIQWSLGERTAHVFAHTSSRVLTDLKTPDAYVILLRFPSGVLACVEAAWILPEDGSAANDFQAEALGSEGALYISVQDQGLRIDRRGGLRFSDVTFLPTVRGHAQGVYVEELRHFVSMIGSDTQPVCTLAEARAAVAVVLAAEESAASGVEVTVSP